MKKTIIISTCLLVLMALCHFSANATYQPQNLGWATISIASGTVTEIMNSTAPTVGYLRYCTNCGAAGGAGTICISTGAVAAYQFVLSTGTQCK